MKHNFYKVIGCLVFILMTAPIFAQDIIVTTDAKKIEAQILEVSKSEIKYKEYDNLDGPTFIISTDEISSIIYKNGKVVLYNQSSQQPELNEKSGHTLTSELVEMNEQIKKYEEIVALDETPEKNAPVMSYVSRFGNTYYYECRRMRGADYELFLRENCSKAYSVYRNGQRIATAGWALLGFGFVLDCTASAIFYSSINSSNITNGTYMEPPLLASIFSIIGTCCEIACIPTLCVGYAKKHRSADIFNTTCASKGSQAYWSINMSQNGLGVAYNF